MHVSRSPLVCALYLLAALSLLLQSCNLPIPGEAAVTYLVGASGNEVKLNNGVRVIVPQGSLKGNAELSLGVSAQDPPVPPGSTPIGKVYEISLSPGAELLAPLDVYLPYDRKAGTLESQYAAMRWDGANWTRLPGQIEGNSYHFTTEHNTLYRLNYFEAANYPIMFYNLSGTQVRVWAYSYETFHDVGIVGYTYTGYRHAEGWTSGAFNVPPGMYTQWCAEWPEFTTPVWDIFGGGYWSDFIGNFHFIFSSPVLINRYSEIEANQPETAEVRFAIGGRSPGLCSQDGMTRTVNPNNSLREQPMPWTTLEPGRTNTPLRSLTPAPTTFPLQTATTARTNTPVRTVTPASSATRVRTNTPARTSTPVRTATSSLNIGNFIVSSQHIDRQEALLVVLAHHQDDVTLRGPITVNYVYYHKAKVSDPPTIDPPIRYVIKSGETRRFELDDLYGVNDIYLYLVSSP